MPAQYGFCVSSCEYNGIIVAASQDFFIISPLLIMTLMVFAVVSHLSNPRFWSIHQLKTNIFFHVIKVAGRPFGINLIGFDWNLADSEISWPQLYIQVELSSKTAVSQLLASPSVSYFWSTCHPQHLFFFFPEVNGAEMGENATIVRAWKMRLQRPFRAPAAVWRKEGPSSGRPLLFARTRECRVRSSQRLMINSDSVFLSRSVLSYFFLALFLVHYSDGTGGEWF